MRILILAFLLLSSATLVLAETLSLSYTMTAADVDRLVAAHQTQANTSINGTATRSQVLAYIKSKVASDLMQATKQFERHKAITAITDPTPIDPR